MPRGLLVTVCALLPDSRRAERWDQAGRRSNPGVLGEAPGLTVSCGPVSAPVRIYRLLKMSPCLLSRACTSPSAEGRSSISGRERRSCRASSITYPARPSSWTRVSPSIPQIHRIATLWLRHISLHSPYLLGHCVCPVGVQTLREIRKGRRRPHPRHWQALAQLADVAPTGQ